MERMISKRIFNEAVQTIQEQEMLIKSLLAVNKKQRMDKKYNSCLDYFLGALYVLISFVFMIAWFGQVSFAGWCGIAMGWMIAFIIILWSEVA